MVLKLNQGFDYQFNALPDEKQNELNNAFATMFSAGQQISLLLILQASVPILQIIVCVCQYPDFIMHIHN